MKKGLAPLFFQQLPMLRSRLLGLSVSCLTHIKARCGDLGSKTMQK